MLRIGLLATMVLATAVAAQEPVSKGIASLQGRWLVVQVGEQTVAPTDPEGAFMVTGDKYVQGVGGRVTERGTIQVDGTKQPMTIDFVISAGRFANTRQLGIFEVSGDTVRFHLAAPGATTRPENFTPKEGFELVVAKKRAAAVSDPR
jgi:uncharacterized protein (TIGR03067 family)